MRRYAELGNKALGLVLLMWVLAHGVNAHAAAERGAGAALYDTCAACHGKDGGGQPDGTVPAIGGQPAAVVLKALEDFRSARRRDLRMQHFADAEHLPGRAELEALAVHVASLRRTSAAAQGPGTALEAAARSFARQCAACHGAAGGAVAARGIPALAGQHFTYLERKLREVAEPSAPLARSHGVIVSRLPATEITAIADWLSRQPPP